MKNNICLGAFALLFFCSSAFAQGGKYTITGVMSDKSMDGHKVMMVGNTGYLQEKGASGSTDIIDGKFVLEGRLNDTEPSLASIMLYVDSATFITMNIILEPGNITVRPMGRHEYVVSGTPLNDEFYSQVTVPYNSSREASEKSAEARAVREKAKQEKTWTREDEKIFYDNTTRISVKHKLNLINFIDKYIEKYPKVVVTYIDQFRTAEPMIYHDFVMRIAEPYRTRLLTRSRRVE